MKTEKKAERKARSIAIGYALILSIISSILIATNPNLITWGAKISIILLMLIVIFCFSALIYVLLYLYFREKNH